MTRYELWNHIISTSDELEELTRRYDELDEEGRLPEKRSQAKRSESPQLETRWRELDEDEEVEELSMSMSVIEIEQASLEPLQRGARASIEGLWEQLRTHEQLANQDAFTRVRDALVIHFDERILELLPRDLRPSWTLLQTAYTGSRVGGDDFYRFVDSALGDRSVPSLVFEVYYFCLSHEFEGRYANDHAAIREYERNVETRIEVETPEVPRAEEPTRVTLREPWPTRRYYILAALIVLAYTLLLTLWTNRGAEEPGAEALGNTPLSVMLGGRRAP